MISDPEFRNALRHFPAGVTLVTLRSGSEIHGLTVSAFASVSTEPPLVMTVIDHRHKAYELLERPDATFAVNILREDQSALSDRFAFLREGDRFEAGSWGTAVTGAPVLTEALAWLDCEIRARYPAGTHSIYLGEVVAAGVPTPGQPPLIYWNRTYRKLASAEGSGSVSTT